MAGGSWQAPVGRLVHVNVNQDAAGTLELAGAVAGHRHKVLGALLSMSVLGTLQFSDGVGSSGPLDINASSPFIIPTSVIPYWATADGLVLNLVTTLGAARGLVVVLTEPVP